MAEGELAPSTRLGPYTLLEKLGRGGMGEVYLARDSKLGREVALKLLAPSLCDDPERRARFRREARAAAALNHPNITTIYEVGESGGRDYIAFERVFGRTLAQVLAEGPLPSREILRLALPLAEALTYAHGKGVIHRDVKAGNVMISESGVPKLLDFGLAKVVETALDEGDEHTPALTMSGAIFGTPSAMSPEQATGRPVDERSDVFSFGSLLYEMAAGRPAFPGKSALEVIGAVIHREPESLSNLRPAVPAALVALVDRALRKDPAQRFQTMADLTEELRRVAGGRRSGRRTLPLALWALAAVAAILLMIRPWRGGGSGAGTDGTAGVPAAAARLEPTTVAVLPFEVRGSSEFAYLGDGLVDLLGTKLDGAADLRCVDSHALLSYLVREPLGPGQEGADRVADHFGAGLFLRGDVLVAGRGLHLSATLYDRRAEESVGNATVEGTVEQVFDLVDELVAELLRERFSGVAERVTRVATATTESLPALKAYLLGEERFHRGRFTESLDAFEEAVAIDPDFALAWYRLSVAAEWATRQERSEQAAQRALALAERLSDHDRQLLEARLAGRRGDGLEAEARYRAILALFPDDVEAWTQLSEVQFHYGPVRGEPLSKARAAWERVQFFAPENIESLWHLARIAADEGDRRETARLVDRILALNPEGERSLEMEALRAFELDDASDEERVLTALRASSEIVVQLSAWNVACFTGDLEGARRVIRLNTEPGRVADAQAMAHLELASLEMAEGRWERAHEEIERAAALRPGWALEQRALLAVMPFSPAGEDELTSLRAALLAWDAAAEPPALLSTTFLDANDPLHPAIRLHLLGLVEARLRLPEALERATALEQMEALPLGPYLMTDLAAEVRARVAWEGGDRVSALHELDGTRRHVLYQIHISSPFGSQAYGRYAHAEALAAAGRDEDALRLYSSFRNVSPFELAFDAPATLARARILEQRGDSELAAGEYRRFLGRWGQADALLAERVEEARRSLRALER